MGTPEGLLVTEPFYFQEHGNIFFSLSDSSARDINEQIKTDNEYRLKVYPCVHIGQMSRTQLSALPESTARLDEFLDSQETHTSPQQIRKYVDLGSDLAGWSESLEVSRTLDNKGPYNAYLRETTIGAFNPIDGQLIHTWETIGKQVSFVVNPAPEAFPALKSWSLPGQRP